ncbi:MAG: hypothetical protein K2P76_05015 [Lachnospiraceae bacterium]|nr:hypothetical protein [Lachnospiraceae bacterium]
MKLKKTVSVAFLAFFLLLPHINAQGEKTLDFKEYIPGGEEGENVSVKTDAEKGKLDIQFSFEETGYHTVTAFQNDMQELQDEIGVRFTVENLSGGTARMNLAVINSEGTVLQVKDGCYVRLTEKDVPGEASYSPAENGCFELPEGFYGDVEIPFSLCVSEVGVADHSTDKITAYGVVCVTEGKTPCHLVFHKMSFADKKHIKDAKEGAFLEIEGPDSMLKSHVGESKEKYRAVVYNMLGEGEETKASFSLGENSQGITADEEGWVVVSEDLSQESFTLKAEISQGMRAQKKILLQESWTMQVLTENGYDASIAPPSEIRSVEGEMAVLTEERILWTIRLSFVAAVVLLFAYYAVVRKRNRMRRE